MPSPTLCGSLAPHSAWYTGTEADTVQCPQTHVNSKLSSSEPIRALEDMTLIVFSGNFYQSLSNLKQAQCPCLPYKVLSR